MALTGWEARPFVAGPISQAAGGSAVQVPVMRVPRKLKLDAVRIAVGAAITADDSNYVTIALTDGATTYATASTTTSGTGDISANSFVDLTISTAEVDAGTQLYLSLTQAGTGVDVTNLVMQLEFEYQDA